MRERVQYLVNSSRFLVTIIIASINLYHQCGDHSDRIPVHCVSNIIIVNIPNVDFLNGGGNFVLFCISKIMIRECFTKVFTC